MSIFGRIMGALAICLALTACDPERNLSDPEKIFVGPTWRTEAAFLDGQPDSTDFSQFRLTFKPRGKWKSTEVDGSTHTGSWTFSESDSTLTTIDQNLGLFAEYYVPLLDDQHFHLRFTVAARQLEWHLIPL